MSVIRRSEFQGLDAIEKVATTKAIHRCRTLAEWIVNKLARETEPFHDLAEFAAFQALPFLALCRTRRIVALRQLMR